MCDDSACCSDLTGSHRSRFNFAQSCILSHPAELKTGSIQRVGPDLCKYLMMHGAVVRCGAVGFVELLLLCVKSLFTCLCSSGNAAQIMGPHAVLFCCMAGCTATTHVIPDLGGLREPVLF